MRLRSYDDSQAGAYFVTIFTHNREILFGEIANRKMMLNQAGRIVADEWSKSVRIRVEIELDAWVVMPNHLHGIVIITNGYRRGDLPVAPTTPGPKPKSIGALMAGFKSAAAKRINVIRGTPGAAVWQRNYFKHIIRDDAALNRIRLYIAQNPSRWGDDTENPERQFDERQKA